MPHERNPTQSTDSTPLVIRDIRVESQAEQEKVLIFANRFFSASVFTLEGEKPRVVIDIPNSDSIAEGLRTIPANGRFIKKIRTRRDERTGTFRVVLELDPEVNYKVDQLFFESENVYVIEVGQESGSERK